MAIPALGRPARLRQAVESAAAGAPEEILVVDDASEEDLRSALTGLSVRYLRNAENLGMVRNWNRCMESATGEVVVVLHSDETLAPDALDRVRRAFREHPELGMVYSGHGKPGVVVPAGAAAAREICRGVYPCSSVFLARWAVDVAGVYDETLPYSPDQEYYPRVARHAAMLCMQPPLARGSDHKGRTMFSTWREPDFYDQFRRVRSLAWEHAGRHGAERDLAVEEDLAEARRYILDTAWRHGFRSIVRSALAEGGRTGIGRFWHVLSFVPWSGWLYRLARSCGVPRF